MSAELVPKLTDLKNLQDLAKIFALPMLAVAYIMQTGLVITNDDSIWLSVHWELSPLASWSGALIIVVLKTLWMALCGVVINFVIGVLHTECSQLVYPLTAMCLFTFGLLGLFPPEEVVARMTSVSNFWFYACFVWGFYFVSMDRQLSEA